MEKITKLVKTTTKDIKGYSWMPGHYPVTEQDLFNLFVDIIPKNKRYIKYFLREEFVEKPEYEKYQPDPNYYSCGPISRGDTNFYVDIYVDDSSEEKHYIWYFP
jgi:hypothetical protein